MGRPPTESAKIDAAELKKLMGFCPSEQEAANWFGVNPKTPVRFIRKHFKCSFVEMRDKSFVKTKIAIKRVQIDKALKGDNTMLIWCGKQYLEQREKSSQEISGPNGKPVELKAVSDLTDEQLEEKIKALESRRFIGKESG